MLTASRPKWYDLYCGIVWVLSVDMDYHSRDYLSLVLKIFDAEVMTSGEGFTQRS